MIRPALARAAVGAVIMMLVAGCAGAGSPSSSSAPARSVALSRPAPPPRTVTLAAAGDIACKPPFRSTSRTCQQRATAGLIRRYDPDAVLALGDTQYDRGRYRDYLDSYDRSWGRFRDRTLPVVGNHEYLTRGAAGYFRYFGAPAHGPRGWYAVDRGQWRIYVLNTNCRFVSCTLERRWLARDLAAHPRRCSLAAMHHPRFSSGPHGPSRDARRFWPLLDRHQVDLALAGHDHVYERFAPMHADGTVSRTGIRSFVVGTGGEELYPLGTATHGSRFRYADRLGVLFLRLGATAYHWTFRAPHGPIRDSGTSRCIR